MLRMKRWGGAVVVLGICLSLEAQARAILSIETFTNKAQTTRCEKSKISPTIEAELQASLIRHMAGYRKYGFKERSVRPLKHKHKLTGAIRTLEVCNISGRRGEEVEIALDVQMHNAKGELTHMFSGNAKVAHSGKNKALKQAINVVMKELAHRIDIAIPNNKGVELPLATLQPAPRSRVVQNEYEVHLIRKPNSVPPSKK
jgi:hypothetical protein